MSESMTAMGVCLKQEIEGATELLHVLQEEQNQLLTKSIDALEPLIGQKANLVARLSQHTRDRQELLRKSGFDASLAGMTAWLDNVQGSKTDVAGLKEDWNKLVSLSRSAKEMNRLNGLLISSHMARNQQALAILHGSHYQNTGMYGPDGHPSRIPATPVRSVVTG